MANPSPARPLVARLYRTPLAWLEARLWLPRLPPSLYSAASLVFSLGVWLVPPPAATALLVALALLADWLDGATARRFGSDARRGYLTDVLVDRVSEGLIFTAAAGNPVGRLFIGLWLLNCLLVAYSLRSGRHRILPLRFAYLAALVAWPLWSATWRGG